ncbi:MAG TPA: nucleoside hydrolase [Kaistia sp.]|nr:nucleoside hydrolase [Kaistia sp.]
MASPKHLGGLRSCIARAAALLVLMVLMSSVAPHQADAAMDGGACVVIDTDFDIDDMMAIPVVIGNRHVAAIVTSEGVTPAEVAARALSRLIAEPEERAIPVIVGASSRRSDAEIRRKWSWLPYFRAAMSRTNDLLAAPLAPAPRSFHNFTEELARATADCRRVDLLITGTYTSFIRYSTKLAPKLGHVVVMGKPIGDPLLKPGQYSFNCGYDLPACRTAMVQLRGIRTSWVDVPRGTDPLYAPSLAMVEGLRPYGLTGSLKAALLANQHTWNPAKLHLSPDGFGESLMWDESAALYLLHPELFTPVGRHYEPRVIGGSHERTRARLLRTWTHDTNAATSYR